MINNGGKMSKRLLKVTKVHIIQSLSPLSTYAQILIAVHWDIGKRTPIQIFVLYFKFLYFCVL